MAYLYRHIRLDKNEPFYIGIGSDSNYNRAHDKSQRTKYWKSIILKSDYRIDIVLSELTWKQACEKEVEFIKLYGRKDLEQGSLCNFTNGGEGNPGRVPSESIKKKISESVKKNTHWKDGRKHTPEAVEKIRQAAINMDRTGIGEKISKGLKGKPKHFNTLLNLKKGPATSAKKVIDITSNDIFNSIAEAASSINMRSSLLARKLKGTRPNTTNFILI